MERNQPAAQVSRKPSKICAELALLIAAEEAAWPRLRTKERIAPQYQKILIPTGFATRLQASKRSQIASPARI